jgi:hypothetical protein
MERIGFIDYEGKQILLEDFSELKPGEEFIQTIAMAKQMIASQPPKSVLALMDATNARFNTEALSLLSDFVKSNTPYIKCAVVVGIEGLLKVALSTISQISGRAFHTFSNREEAKKFLSQQ